MRRSLAMQERVAMVISKPPATRTTPEIDVLLPWLRKRSDLLRDLEKNVLIDVLKQCECRRAIADDVLLKQGETGDTLFVILNGTVSVYVDAKKTGENLAPEKPKPIIHMHDHVKQTSSAQSVKSARTTKQSSHLGHKELHTPKQSSHLNAQSSEHGVSKTPSQSQDPTESSHNAHHIRHLEAQTTQHATLASSQSSAAEPKQEEEEEEIPEEIEIEVPKKRFVKLDRSKFGKWVVKFGVGQCFGELALINSDSVRNATIIADEDCIFMIINRDVFNRTLKSYQEEEYSDRKDFVDTHPVFRGWNSKFKKLLEMSIIKEVHSFNTTLIKQGDPYRGLLFIRSGRTKLHVEPDLHRKQYPDRYPFKAENDLYELELIKKPKQRRKEVSQEEESTVETKQVHVRRKQGYAAAERRITTRSVPLCILERGEMIGDIELANNLPSYMQTVTCAAQTVLYVLTPKNFERLINSKNNRSTLEKLRRHVENKLRNRIASQQGSHVPLLKHLLFKMTEELQPKPVVVPPLRGTKELPEREVLFQHLVTVFKQNKAELIEPHVPGAIYYREMMRERARVRESHARQRKKKTKAQTQEELNAIKKRVRRKPDFVTKVARSTKALIAAMEKQKQMEEEMHRNIITNAVRAREEEEVRLMHEDELARTAEQEKITEEPEDIPVSSEPEDVASKTETESDRKRLDSIRETTETEQQLVKSDDPDPLSRKASMILERIKTFLTEIDATSDPGDAHHEAPDEDEVPQRAESAAAIIENIDIVEESAAPNQPASLAHALEAAEFLYRSEESEQPVMTTPIPYPKPVPKPKKDRLKVHFVQTLLKKASTLRMKENPTYRDWETSDRTLGHLEERVRAFAQSQSSEKVTGLPKLRRFEADDEEIQQPIPGGRVLVQRKACAATGKYALNNHRHVHYRVIPRLQQADRLRREKMLMQLLTDDTRAGEN